MVQSPAWSAKSVDSAKNKKGKQQKQGRTNWNSPHSPSLAFDRLAHMFYSIKCQ